MSEPAPAPISPPATTDRWRVLVRALWFGLVPLLASLATMRWLVPARADAGVGPWGALAELAAVYPMPLALGFLVLYALLARVWRDHLPLRRWLEPEARAAQSLPQRLTAGALIAFVLLGAVALRRQALMFCEVVGGSMLPTLLPEDTLVVSRQGSRPPRRGDVITFRTGRAQRETSAQLVQGEAADRLVKRVIGLPGDEIATVSGVPIINGWEVPHCDAGTYVRYAATGTVAGRLLVEFLEDRAYLSLQVAGTQSFPGYRVKSGEVFVLGDDRFNSDDSRSWRDGQGAGVPLAAIEGSAWRVIGADRDGRLDLGRFLQRPGLSVNLPGVDVRGLQSGVERCLKTRPQRTWPPPPALSSAG